MGKTIEVIIPTYKPGKQFIHLIELLKQQSYPVSKISIENTEVKYWTAEMEQLSELIEVTHIGKDYFDHGRTRDHAARRAQGDYILFMTQDAIPADQYLVENLVKAMDQPNVAVSYGRQLPSAHSNLIEQFTRNFNYPEKSRVKFKKDIPELQIKTFFCSDVCAMYDRRIYLEQGGFEKKIIFNEDMVFAGRLVEAGFGVAYAADARVIHSHNYSALEQFHRNFDLGVSQADFSDIFGKVKSTGEGIRLVKKTAAWLIRQKRPWCVIQLFWQSGWKFLGYSLGKRYRSLPGWLILRCTMNQNYWNGVI